MNNSTFHIFIIIILSSLQTLISFNTLVPSICHNISRLDPTNIPYETCVSTLESDPRSASSTAPQLARITFELAISKAKAITLNINEVLKVMASDSVAKNSLKYCLGIYTGVPGELEAGINGLDVGNFDTANVRVGGAMKGAETCRDAIKDTKGGGLDPLRQKINEFNQLGALCIDFIKLLRTVN